MADDIQELGSQDTTRGILICWNGEGISPGTIAVADSNGKLWYLYSTPEGILRIHDEAPTSNIDGAVVGTQF